MPAKTNPPEPEKKKRFRSTFRYEGHRYEATGKTQKEADQKAAIMRDKLMRGESGISGNMSVSRWMDEWFEAYRKHSIGISQQNKNLVHMRLIARHIGAMKVKAVKDIHVQKILNERAGYSKSDLTKLRNTLRQIFHRAKKARLIDHNPAEDLELPVSTEGSFRNITDYEREKILKLCKTHHAGLWVKFILYTGARPNETRALDWQHIDFENRLVKIRAAMKAGTSDIAKPKTAAGERDIPINSELYEILLEARKEPHLPVFTKPKSGKRHIEKSMASMWNNFKRELDISMGATVYRNEIKESVVADDLRPYCLRHTYATDLQDAGVPINVARYLMGHSDIRVTSKIYTHTTDIVIQDAARKIENAGIYNGKNLTDGGKNGGRSRVEI